MLKILENLKPSNPVIPRDLKVSRPKVWIYLYQRSECIQTYGLDLFRPMALRKPENLVIVQTLGLDLKYVDQRFGFIYTKSQDVSRPMVWIYPDYRSGFV